MIFKSGHRMIITKDNGRECLNTLVSACIPVHILYLLHYVAVCSQALCLFSWTSSQDRLNVIEITFLHPALTPGPVQNLTAAVDTHKPSVTLKWQPPANVLSKGDITKYTICFWNKENGFYTEKTVSGSTTTTKITRKCGLRPLTTTTFEVRAYSGDNVSRECKTVSRFVGMYTNLYHIGASNQELITIANTVVHKLLIQPTGIMTTICTDKDLQGKKVVFKP